MGGKYYMLSIFFISKFPFKFVIKPDSDSQYNTYVVDECIYVQF